MSCPNRKTGGSFPSAYHCQTLGSQNTKAVMAGLLHDFGPGRLLRGVVLVIGIVAGGGAQAQETEATTGYGSYPVTQSIIARPATAALDADDNDVEPVKDSDTAAPVLPAFVPIAIVAGEVDPDNKVPAFNDVAGSGVPNLSVADPQVLLTHGTTYCYTVILQDYKVTGSAEVDYYIQQVIGGKTVTIQKGTPTAPFTSNAGDFWAYAFCNALPDSPGVATLIGRVRWGTGFAEKALVKSNVLIK